MTKVDKKNQKKKDGTAKAYQIKQAINIIDGE